MDCTPLVTRSRARLVPGAGDRGRAGHRGAHRAAAGRVACAISTACARVSTVAVVIVASNVSDRRYQLTGGSPAASPSPR